MYNKNCKRESLLALEWSCEVFFSIELSTEDSNLKDSAFSVQEGAI